MRPLLVALSFLTLFPVRLKGITEEEVGSSTSSFPLVGLVKGGLLYIIAVALGRIFPSHILSWIVVSVNIFITGALHIDGLSDTFDAIAVRGTKEKKLEVMKDSRAGPVGLTSVVLLVLGKFLLVMDILKGGSFQALLLFPVAGTTAMAMAIFLFRPAREDGLGRLFMTHTGRGGIFLCLFWTIFIVVGVGALFDEAVPAALAMAGGLITGGYLLGIVFDRHFGGHTGDTLGTLSEVSEVAFLFIYVVLLKVMTPA